MYKYAIFDLDGTLADTLEDLANAVNYALDKNGFEKYPISSYKQMVGSGIVNLIKKATGCEDDKTVLAVKSDFDNYYKVHAVDNTCAYPGEEEMLTNLQSKGVVLAVLSNKPDAFVKSILDKIFPKVEFKMAWGKKEGFAIKPDPQSLNAMLAELNADKESTVYVGDSNVDVYTAQNGEVGFIGCSWGFRGENELIEAGADKVAHNCEELESMILGE